MKAVYLVKRRIIMIFLVAFISISIISGCEGSKMSSLDNKQRQSKQGKLNISVLLYSHGFEFMVALDEGIREEAKKQGVNVIVLDGQAKSEIQISQVEDNIAKKVDAIILSPNNSDELVPGVRKANTAGIPVVTVDAVVSPGPRVASAVAFDNIRAGRIAAEYIQKKLGKGTVLEFQGAQGAYHSKRRNSGFIETIKNDKNFKIISKDANWEAETAQNITADIITANPQIGGIYSHNDEMVRGIIGGIKQLGKAKKVAEPGHIVIVGIDGTPLALERIRNGEQDATVQQDPFEMGTIALRTSIDVINGKQVPPEIFIQPMLITKDNVDNPNLWGNRFKKQQ